MFAAVCAATVGSVYYVHWVQKDDVKVQYICLRARSSRSGLTDGVFVFVVQQMSIGVEKDKERERLWREGRNEELVLLREEQLKSQAETMKAVK